MKSVLVVLFLLGAFAAGAQDITIQSFKPSDIDFREYKTYFWSEQVDDQLDEGGYFLNDLLLKADVRDAVHSELEARDYKRDEFSADLLVNFRVFDKSATLRRLEGFGRTYWRADEISSNFEGTNEINVEAGTLIISLLDKGSRKLVWQGIASGLKDENGFIKDEGKIREAVRMLFEAYGYRASIYTRR